MTRRRGTRGGRIWRGVGHPGRNPAESRGEGGTVATALGLGDAGSGVTQAGGVIGGDGVAEAPAGRGVSSVGTNTATKWARCWPEPGKRAKAVLMACRSSARRRFRRSIKLSTASRLDSARNNMSRASLVKPRSFDFTSKSSSQAAFDSSRVSGLGSESVVCKALEHFVNQAATFEVSRLVTSKALLSSDWPSSTFRTSSSLSSSSAIGVAFGVSRSCISAPTSSKLNINSTRLGIVFPVAVPPEGAEGIFIEGRG